MSRRAAFTLIEMLMVVLVVGILASVAIPTYAGQKTAAQDVSAKSLLEVALREGAAEFTERETFGSLLAALQAGEPAVTFTAGAAFTERQVSVETPSPTRAVYRSRSASGRRFAIRDQRTELATGGLATVRCTATLAWDDVYVLAC